jgi:hypothetical protein
VDIAGARAELGLGSAPTWTEVRIAYRVQIAASHPDRAGGDPARAAAVTEAYATLERAHREGHLAERFPAPPAPAPPAPHQAAEPLDEPPEVLEGDTVHLAVPPDEAFARIVDACHRIGDLTYIDRSCAILEALLPVDGEGVCSLVISLQGRADGTDAFCTLEAIEHVGAPPVRPIVERLVSALRHPNG